MFNPIPFLTYIFLMAYTPGPNNIMSMTKAQEMGFKKSFPFNLGIFFGCTAVMMCCAFFSGALFWLIPQIKPFMLTAGACYMLWLAWKQVAPSKKGAEGNGGKGGSGLLAGALLQFINPKLYIYGITSISSYILPFYSAPVILAGFALLLGFVGFSGTVFWALSGAWLNSMFKDHKRVVGVIMAVLLCYCAVSLFL